MLCATITRPAACHTTAPDPLTFAAATHPPRLPASTAHLHAMRATSPRQKLCMT